MFPRNVKDRVVQHPSRYRLVSVAGTNDTYDFVAEPGNVSEVGTFINKDYLQPIEDEIANLKSSVSSGKQVLETTIIDKGGVVSKQGDVVTFNELGEGIGSIPVGGEFESNNLLFRTIANNNFERTVFRTFDMLYQGLNLNSKASLRKYNANGTLLETLVINESAGGTDHIVDWEYSYHRVSTTIFVHDRDTGLLLGTMGSPNVGVWMRFGVGSARAVNNDLWIHDTNGNFVHAVAIHTAGFSINRFISNRLISLTRTSNNGYDHIIRDVFTLGLERQTIETVTNQHLASMLALLSYKEDDFSW